MSNITVSAAAFPRIVAPPASKVIPLKVTRPLKVEAPEVVTLPWKVASPEPFTCVKPAMLTVEAKVLVPASFKVRVWAPVTAPLNV